MYLLTPAFLRHYRCSNYLTLAECGLLVHRMGSAWARWELGGVIDPAIYELLLIKLRLHDYYVDSRLL
jgi:hypothetical protein